MRQKNYRTCEFMRCPTKTTYDPDIKKDVVNESISFLKNYEIKYDEKYLFDWIE